MIGGSLTNRNIDIRLSDFAQPLHENQLFAQIGNHKSGLFWSQSRPVTVVEPIHLQHSPKISWSRCLTSLAIGPYARTI